MRAARSEPPAATDKPRWYRDRRIIGALFFAAIAFKYGVEAYVARDRARNSEYIRQLLPEEFKKEQAERTRLMQKYPLVSFEEAKAREAQDAESTAKFERAWSALADDRGSTRPRAEPDPDLALPAITAHTRPSEWREALAQAEQARPAVPSSPPQATGSRPAEAAAVSIAFGPRDLAAAYLQFESLNARLLPAHCARQDVDLAAWQAIFEARHRNERQQVEAILGGKDAVDSFLLYTKSADSLLQEILESELRRIAELNGLPDAKAACVLLARHGERVAERMHLKG
jgi:hypothetical protein